MQNEVKFERRYDIDWLRIIATIMIFFYHSAKAFDMTDWHIKNEELSLEITIMVGFFTIWLMPLFFILSGISIYYSLKKRQKGIFIKERVKRLLIPWIFGVIFLLSIHAYFEALYNGYNGSYIEFYSSRYFLTFPFIFGIYLWYLLFLFIFSLICYPIFKYYAKENNREKISNFAKFLARRGMIYILAIPLIITEMITHIIYVEVRGKTNLGFGGWQLPSYLFFFIYGYLFASNPQFKEIIERNMKIYLIIGLITLPFALLYFIFVDISELLSQFFIFLLLSISFAVCSLSWLFIIFGLGAKLLNVEYKKLNFLNELVLPFYILHQTIIVIVDFYVVQLKFNIIVKYFMVIGIAFPLVLILVLLIRSNNITRFLFGMRQKKKNKFPKEIRTYVA
ncbi:MAG: acyltransferase [Promethearchaeota archaeon]